jgi:hypothetical protein
MIDLLLGGIAVASFIVALFFMRFWRTSGDRFFLFFAASFAVEGANRVYASLSGSFNEDVPAIYGVRLLSYALIIVAIADKNRR